MYFVIYMQCPVILPVGVSGEWGGSGGINEKRISLEEAVNAGNDFSWEPKGGFFFPTIWCGK